MAKRILIIIGHPAKERLSFSEALGLAYMKGAQVSGHEVQLINIARLNFDPILHEGYEGDQPPEQDISDAQQKILWAKHLVIIYPMWGYMTPGLLKGFFERTFTPGFAYAEQSSNPLNCGLLSGKSAQIIQTMGMPGFVYRILYQAHGAKALRDMLKFCGIRPININYFGAIDDSEKRNTYVERATVLGRKGF
jgi:putative NADPH-quinone reductase